ncbi:MAG: RIP metalloprotease RseP [Smithellaceae bacterium]|nr:RIP metalloprotease RseP [Smithellaceae bacterium]MDD3258652.1 RIP metalloprotease RseP [Smithellaceae bacterium]MDD3848873.1 RIP metalloprotease RseP [Smithellaceae bacterium]HOG11992.1 RIP metalloprotease RseP [Smithellaceae bacterium]HOQ71191.1 RIP metalloprotease RseP [Smithellaceae bacterium]
MVTFISFIVLLGILIFAHELGHFLAARAGGVGVLKFSLGFGPKIFGKKIGETEYVLSWIPLGGFVKLLGESGAEELPAEDEKRSFYKQPRWKRMLIVLAGPVFNFLLAVFIFFLVYMHGLPNLLPVIGELSPDSAAASSGILKDDAILSINDREITFWDEIKPVILKAGGADLTIRIRRGGEEKIFAVKPKLTKTKNIFGEEESTYLIGISPAGKTVIEKKNPTAAMASAVEKTWEISKLTVISVVKMLEGVLSPRTLGGPIFIAQVAGNQVREGIIPFVLFMAILSINLGVINLFPIPVLDGGHIFFYLIEMAARREIPVKIKEWASQIGFVFLLMLMLFVIMIDIERLNIGPVNKVLQFFR